MAKPSLVVPRLFLSNLFAARNEDVLRDLHVTHVISVLQNPPKFPPNIADRLEVLHISIPDSSETDLLKYLETTTAFIKAALAENETNVVLVRRHRYVLTC